MRTAGMLPNIFISAKAPRTCLTQAYSPSVPPASTDNWRKGRISRRKNPRLPPSVHKGDFCGLATCLGTLKKPQKVLFLPACNTLTCVRQSFVRLQQRSPQWPSTAAAARTQQSLTNASSSIKWLEINVFVFIVSFYTSVKS